MSSSTGLPAEAMRRLELAVERSKRTSAVRFPVGFIRTQRHGEDPPLAHLLRAGDVRLKLHLHLALIATRSPFEIDAPPAHYLAGVLNLPASTGARRISEALTWLHDNGFIDRVRRPGATPHIRVLHHGSVSAANGRYVRAPLSLWTNGWILTLPARAIALFLILQEASGGSSDNSAVLSGSRKDQYGLSTDTWARAADDLAERGLLDVKEVFAAASSRDEYEPKRRRRRYTLKPEGLESRPRH